MFAQLPLIIGLFFILLCVAAAALMLPKRDSQSRLVPSLHPSPEPMVAIRARTQYEIETDEDLAVIADVYRDQRRADRAQQALERLGRITPSSTKSK